MRLASLIGNITEAGSKCRFFGGRDDGIKTWIAKADAVDAWHTHSAFADLGLTPPVLSDVLHFKDKHGDTRYGFVVGKAKVFGDGVTGDLVHHEIDGWDAEDARADVEERMRQHGYWFGDDHFGNVGIYEGNAVLIDCEEEHCLEGY